MSTSGSDSEEFESADEGGESTVDEQPSSSLTDSSGGRNIDDQTASDSVKHPEHVDASVDVLNDPQDNSGGNHVEDSSGKDSLPSVTTLPAEVQSHKTLSPVSRDEKQTENGDCPNSAAKDEIPPELLLKVATRKMPSKERPRTKPTLGAKKLGAVKISNAEFQNSSKLPDPEKTDEPPRGASLANPKTAYSVEASLRKLEVSKEANITAQDSGKGWGWWAPPKSLFNSVSSVTTQILSTVEAGLNIPDPEELARTDVQDRTKDGRLDVTDTSPSTGIKKSSTKEEASSSMGLPFIGGMSTLTRLVESTGTRVLSTGLDTLELLGRKTMNVLQENDPGLKKARAALVGQLTSNKPSLSQVLREAKEQEEIGTDSGRKTSEDDRQLPALLDHHQGLMHLEALEMLSDQCNKQLGSVTGARSASVCRDIREACDLDEESEDLPDVEPGCPDFDILQARLATALESVATGVSHAKLIKEIRYGYERVENEDTAQLQTLAVDSLARLVSSAVEVYHKYGELLVLEKSKNAQLDWKTVADSLGRYSLMLRTEIQRLAEFYVVKLVQSNAASNEHSTDIYMEASKCIGYVKTALRLMVPILQHCAIN